MNSYKSISIIKTPNLLQRIWFLTSDFLFYQLFIIILIDNYEKLYVWVLYIFLTTISLISSLSSKNRIILKIKVDYDVQLFQIEYIYIFRVKRSSVPFDCLDYTFKKELYGRLKTPFTLTIYNNKKIVAKLIKEISYGWTTDQIDDVHSLIKKTKQYSTNSNSDKRRVLQ